MALPSEEEVQDFLEERSPRLLDITRFHRIVVAPSASHPHSRCTLLVWGTGSAAGIVPERTFHQLFSGTFASCASTGE